MRSLGSPSFHRHDDDILVGRATQYSYFVGTASSFGRSFTDFSRNKSGAPQISQPLLRSGFSRELRFRSVPPRPLWLMFLPLSCTQTCIGFKLPRRIIFLSSARLTLCEVSVRFRLFLWVFALCFFSVPGCAQKINPAQPPSPRGDIAPAHDRMKNRRAPA